ncbi:ATP-dependent DNA helicase [Xylophilus rhododendri]|uniref:ATP-dependent DNA helicase n=1 Tax=Xylophilus rhododendri TaxID=2697032 RepID=A0A857J5I4_9BURK|nr:ATP-dependent DNA helicase [Xylophilus rhododendri]QHI99240.1 ATP-dependent DNA helicase [Xylophilus rhododendri]
MPAALPDDAATPPGYTVAVRLLCDFTGRSGDLDVRFSPSPTAQDGIAGHAAVAARRPAPYQREVTLSGRWQGLAVRGRADGYDPVANRLEEIKTHRGDLARQPAHQRALHWAQAEVYGWLLCAERGLAEVELALVYYELSSGVETVLLQRRSAAELRQAFEDRCQRFLAWAEQEAAHRRARDAALARLAFPFGDFRPGQRVFAEAVFRAQRDGRRLMAQAPTGIGKTLATLFPALRACPPAVPPRPDRPGLDRVFYLTARTSGRRLALDALQQLGAGVRVLELVARDKACEYPDRACNGESCPLARGFYDRLPAARAQAAASPQALDRETLRGIALQHQVCPYYLGQEMARWCDVVVGDVNHWFDGSALLFALALEAEWRCGLLVDEAHNLIERARGMYSASLDPWLFAELRRQAPAVLKRTLDRLNRAWKALAPEGEETGARREFDTVPEAFSRALQEAVSAIGETLSEAPPGTDTALLQRFWFELLAFARRAETLAAHSLFDATRLAGRGMVQLDIRNLVPASFLAPRFALARAAVLFSATLRPEDYHRDLLGLPADTASLDVPSPYGGEQLEVRIAHHISTRWQHRESSLRALVDLLGAQFDRAPGNYLAFFSSFDYLQRALELLVELRPDIPVWAQSRGMSEAEREAYLARFAAGGRGIGFAVLGGVFGEGIDLPGDRLIGAFIATLGLPQVNAVNERLKLRLQALYGTARGYDYAYVFPGFQKVVQAAGRVIRSGSDRGTVWLMDDRFDQARYRRLLPGWWVLD